MKINSESTADEVRIEIIPLIDVIFGVLTFFILAALQLTRQQGIAVDLPTASTGVPQIREVFVVSVDGLGQVYIDKQPVTTDQLKQQLVGYKQLNPEGMMVLYAPRTAIYDDVVSVLDILRSIGGDRVALATLPGNSQPPNPLTAPSPGLSSPNSPGAGMPPTAPPTLMPNGNALPGNNLPLPRPRQPLPGQGYPGIPGNPQQLPAGTSPGAPPPAGSTQDAPNNPQPQLPLP